jgi:hypothetical protein
MQIQGAETCEGANSLQPPSAPASLPGATTAHVFCRQTDIGDAVQSQLTTVLDEHVAFSFETSASYAARPLTPMTSLGQAQPPQRLPEKTVKQSEAVVQERSYEAALMGALLVPALVPLVSLLHATSTAAPRAPSARRKLFSGRRDDARSRPTPRATPAAGVVR